MASLTAHNVTKSELIFKQKKMCLVQLIKLIMQSIRRYFIKRSTTGKVTLHSTSQEWNYIKITKRKIKSYAHLKLIIFKYMYKIWRILLVLVSIY